MLQKWQCHCFSHKVLLSWPGLSGNSGSGLHELCKTNWVTWQHDLDSIEGASTLCRSFCAMEKRGKHLYLIKVHNLCWALWILYRYLYFIIMPFTPLLSPLCVEKALAYFLYYLSFPVNFLHHLSSFPFLFYFVLVSIKSTSNLAISFLYI